MVGSFPTPKRSKKSDSRIDACCPVSSISSCNRSNFNQISACDSASCAPKMPQKWWIFRAKHTRMITNFDYPIHGTGIFTCIYKITNQLNVGIQYGSSGYAKPSYIRMLPFEMLQFIWCLHTISILHTGVFSVGVIKCHNIHAWHALRWQKEGQWYEDTVHTVHRT